MSIDYTTTELLTKLKEWAAVPSSQPAFTDERLLNLLSDMQLMKIMPVLIEENQEYLVRYIDYPLVTDKTRYLIPKCAYGGKLRDIKLVKNDDYLELSYLDPTALDRNSDGFYFQGNFLILPEVNKYLNYSLRMTFYQKPNFLVPIIECAKVASITSTTEIVVESVPSTWTGSISVDVIKGIPNFDMISYANTISFVGLNGTLTSAIAQDLEVGDWISLTGEACVSMLPYNFHSILVQAAVNKLQESLGDTEAGAISNAVYKDYETRALNSLSPRTNSQPLKIVNRRSFLR